MTVFALPVLCGVQACATFRDFDSDLNAAVGKMANEVRYPPLDRVLSKRYEAGRVIREYSLTVIGRCRWEFEFEMNSGLIVSWRYPDKHAEKGCHEVATSMT